MSCFKFLIVMMSITVACSGRYQIKKQERLTDTDEQTSVIVNNTNENCSLAKVIMTHTGGNPAYGFRSKTITNPQELIEIERAFKNIEKGNEIEQADGGLLEVELYYKVDNKNKYYFQKQGVVGIIENDNMYEVNIDMYDIYDKSKAEEILVDDDGDVFIFDSDAVNTPDILRGKIEQLFEDNRNGLITLQDGIVLPRYELAEDEIDLIRHKGEFYATMEYDEDRTMIIEFEDKNISNIRFE